MWAQVGLVFEPVGQSQQRDDAAAVVFAVMGVGDEQRDERETEDEQQDVGEHFEGGRPFGKECCQHAWAVDDDEQENQPFILAGVAEKLEEGRHPERGDGGGVDVGQKDDLWFLAFGDEDAVFEEGFEGEPFGCVIACL